MVESGVISYKMVQKVKGQLEKSGCRILGAVLNKVDQENKGYYSGYYSKYYGKYYGYGASGSSDKAEKSEQNTEVNTTSVSSEEKQAKRSRRRK